MSSAWRRARASSTGKPHGLIRQRRIWPKTKGRRRLRKLRRLDIQGFHRLQAPRYNSPRPLPSRRSREGSTTGACEETRLLERRTRPTADGKAKIRPRSCLRMAPASQASPSRPGHPLNELFNRSTALEYLRGSDRASVRPEKATGLPQSIAKKRHQLLPRSTHLTNWPRCTARSRP